MKLLNITVFVLILILTAGCDDHGHDHGEDRQSSAASHGHRDSIDVGTPREDDHGHEHGAGGHDDHGGGHGHDEPDTGVVITHFTDATELFVEFPAFVVGQESAFAAHLTRLDNFKPVASGKVTVTLSGGGLSDEVFSEDGPSTAGIFRPVAVPANAAKRRVVVQLQSEDLNVVHDLGEHTIYPTQDAALAAMPHEPEVEGAISYLKEQQWQVDFALSQALTRDLRASLQATGTIRPRADGEVYLSATTSGHVQSPSFKGQAQFPFSGMPVEQGQVLASISPRLGAGGDLATLKAARDKARSEYHLAKHERERLEKLWKEQAIARHRLHEAESQEAVAKAELNAAERRYRQSTGAKQSTQAGVPILAPISGILAQVHAAPGKYVHEGDALFHIINVDKLWLEARISEADIGRLRQPSGAWFTLEGFGEVFDTFNLGGRLVALGGLVDPVSRTTPLIFEFDNPEQRLRAGMFANVRVFTGDVSRGVSVPASAIYDDGGQEVVYVMLDGESFVRRVVQLGTRDADQVLITSGVNDGEWVVSRGAYLVRLASASPAEAGHGHAH